MAHYYEFEIPKRSYPWFISEIKPGILVVRSYFIPCKSFLFSYSFSAASVHSVKLKVSP